MYIASPGRQLKTIPCLTTSVSIPSGGIAVVIGSSGGIGHAVEAVCTDSGRFSKVVGIHRSSAPPLELTDEESIATAARYVAQLPGGLRLLFDATGMLQDATTQPERTWRHLQSDNLAHAFAINAIGPALLMKHFLPLLANGGKSVFATLSAKVGSIADNRLGGWYGYRASKAALNQFVRTAAVELARQRPEAICVALHPGTVDTSLSSAHSKHGLVVRTPAEAASLLFGVLDRATVTDTGRFLNYTGEQLPW